MAEIPSTGMDALVAWLKKYQPALLEDVRHQLQAMHLAGLGLTTELGLTPPNITPSSSGGIVDTISQVLMVGAQAYLTKQQMDAQKKILDTQLNLALQGKPLLDIDPSQYGSAQIKLGVSSDTKTLLMWGAAGVGVLFVLNMLGGRGGGRRK